MFKFEMNAYCSDLSSMLKIIL